MKTSISIGLSVIFSTEILFVATLPVLAQTTKTINATENKAIPVKVYQGYSVNIRFMQTDEFITYANLDNPSRYSMSFDEILCEGNQSCDPGQPQLIHLRLLQGVKLPHLTSSPRGKTFLTVKTRDKQKRIYL